MQSRTQPALPQNRPRFPLQGGFLPFHLCWSDARHVSKTMPGSGPGPCQGGAELSPTPSSYRGENKTEKKPKIVLYEKCIIPF